MLSTIRRRLAAWSSGIALPQPRVGRTGVHGTGIGQGDPKSPAARRVRWARRQDLPTRPVTNPDAGIDEGTIFRPADLGGSEKYPIFVWGQGACSRDGLANRAAMAEIASHGYFVVADGTPNGTGNRVMDRSQLEAMAAPLIAYIDWAIAENEKPCSAYFQSLAGC